MLAKTVILVVDFATRGVRQSMENRLIKAVCFVLHEERDQGRVQLSVDMPSLPSPFFILPVT